MESLDLSQAYLPALIAGDAAGLLARFSGEPDLDEPLAGRVRGASAFETVFAERSVWLRDRAAVLTPIRTTRAAGRSVTEALLHLTESGRRYELPVAAAFDPAPRPAARLRVYHSLWPLYESHRVRAALLPPDPDAHVAGSVADYQTALAAGDVTAITAAFEDDGYFREPAGGPWIYRGRERVRDFMTHLFGSGGITLEHCTVTDDGVACALEFNAVQLGVHRLVPQAGLAVYERGPSGRLAAARIYDDVNVEALAGPA